MLDKVLQSTEPNKPHRILNDQRGIIMVFSLFVITVLLLLTGASLSFSMLNLRKTSNLKTGTTTFHVADACIQHALPPPFIPLGITFSYTTETTILDSVSFGDSYPCTVKAINDPASPGGDTRAILTSTASGPNSAKKVAVAYIKRGNLGLGAISFPGVSANNTVTNFSGDTFTINGNDQCNAVPAVPGIAVTDPALITEITNNTASDGGLEVNQMDNVMGQGAGASVRLSSPWEKTVIQYTNDYLALDHDTRDGGTYGGNGLWGTAAITRITHVTGDVRIAGTIEGYGVLVLDGSLEVTGNFNFHGLVIMRTEGYIRANGNAIIDGAVLIGENAVGSNVLDVRGNVNILFNSCTLTAADGWVPLPRTAKVVAWQEKLA